MYGLIIDEVQMCERLAKLEEKFIMCCVNYIVRRSGCYLYSDIIENLARADVAPMITEIHRMLCSHFIMSHMDILHIYNTYFICNSGICNEFNIEAIVKGIDTYYWIMYVL